LLQKVRHFEKTRREPAIMFGCAKQLFQIPIHKAQLSRSLAFNLGMLQIAADGDLPRNIDERAGSAEEAAGDPLRAGS
jgi:hypothetical protein